MGKAIWEIAKFVGTLAALAILGSMSEGGSSTYGSSQKTSGSGRRPRVYAPTGRSRGYGPRTYRGTKWYSS